MIYALYLLVTFGVLLFLYFEWQKSVVFHPRYYQDAALYDEHFRFVTTVSDGVELEGCVYEPKSFKATILYFGGRGQDSVGLLPKLAEFLGEYRIVTFNYRGYGKSGGKPSEKALLKDSLHIFEMAKKHFESPILFGYSLGSSVASYVASQKKVEKLLLVGAFTSLDELAKVRYGFSLPLLRYHFRTCEFLQKTEAKVVVVVVSKDDDVVPFENSKKLQNCSNAIEQFLVLERFSHVDLLWSEAIKIALASPDSH